MTVLATAAFAGGAIAATKDSHGNARQAFLNDVAKRLNVTPAQLSAALKAARLDQIDTAVKAGKLTQAQADALKKAIQNGTPPPFGLGHGGPGGRGVPGFPGHAGVKRGFFGPPPLTRAAVSPVAKYLGLTEAQLRTQVMSGKSLAQIAKAQGKSTSGLEQTITAAIKTRLDKAVANKRITAAQEQKILSRLSQGVDDLINRTPPKPGQGGGFGYHGLHPRGFGYHGSRGGFARPGSFAPAPAPPPPAGPTA